MFLEYVANFLLKGVGQRCQKRHNNGLKALWLDKKRLILAKRILQWIDELDAKRN